MAKHLVIVESPTKARTMSRYLGKDYVIESSRGHVRDLPTKGAGDEDAPQPKAAKKTAKKKTARKRADSVLGVDIENGFAPTYRVMPDKRRTISALKTKAKGADVVYLAPDPDREGEAIAWHLKEALDLPDDKVRRVTFDEFTRSAIAAAFDHPTSINMDLVNAQQARRILDRIVGYKLSPLLWKRVQRGLSAGRVQSVAVRLIVEREKEIRAFEARPAEEKEFWRIKAVLSPPGRDEEKFEAELKLEDKKELKNQERANALLARLKDAKYVLAELEQKEGQSAPPPPFSTDLMLSAASSQLRFSARKTSMIAQQLYEGIDLGGSRGTVGLITYMRTDSFNISKQALDAACGFIGKTFGDRYVLDKPNFYKSGKGAQEAHEAIRPTDVTLTPGEAETHLTNDQFRLYRLIWERFVACQMPPARYHNTKASISAADRIFEAKGKRLKFDGYTKVLGRGEEDKDQLLPALAEKDVLTLHDITPSQHFEQPPPRYTEATLIRELKRRGIGRPSTYSPIISTIEARKYVHLVERRFHATHLGEVVTDQLVEHFPKVMDVDFTSRMEESLDDIAEAKQDWVDVLKRFYGPFSEALDQASEKMKEKVVEESDEKCPDCGKPLIYKFSRGGRFLGCSGYPECKFTAPVDAEGNMIEKEPPKETEHKCPKCGSPMLLRDGRYGKFFACSAYPKCKSTMQVGEDGQPVARREPEKTEFTCPKCESPLVKKMSRRGPFFACSAYPKCRTAMSIGEDGKPVEKKAGARGGARKKTAGAPKPKPRETEYDCPECGKKLVIRAGRYGEFFGCSGYPKCKTTFKMGPDGKPQER